MSPSSSYLRLASIATDQWGLVTRRQIGQAGVSAATVGRLVGEQKVLERVARGVYRLAGAPIPDHVQLRAAWLQLAPETPAWQRRPEQGLVSHRSAGALYGIGHLPADTHEFTLPARRQTRRDDVRLHQRPADSTSWVTFGGLPVTRPARIAADLLRDREDPSAVAELVVDAMKERHEDPGAFVDRLAPHAAHFGLRRKDGLAVLRWLVDLVSDPQAERYMREAEHHLAVASEEGAPRAGTGGGHA